MKTNENLIKELAEAKAKIAEVEKQLQERSQQKNDWWTPLGFDHEPQPGEWVLAWDGETARDNVAFKYERRISHYCPYEMEYGVSYKHIAPFPMPKPCKWMMPKLGLWVAVDMNGSKYLYQKKPIRIGAEWGINDGSDHARVKKGHPIDLLTEGMTWADEPREI